IVLTVAFPFPGARLVVFIVIRVAVLLAGARLVFVRITVPCLHRLRLLGNRFVLLVRLPLPLVRFVLIPILVRLFLRFTGVGVPLGLRRHRLFGERIIIGRLDYRRCLLLARLVVPAFLGGFRSFFLLVTTLLALRALSVIIVTTTNLLGAFFVLF